MFDFVVSAIIGQSFILNQSFEMLYHAYMSRHPLND